MSRQSAAAVEMIEHALPEAVLAPPPDLSVEEAALWRSLANAGRLDAGSGPVLRELIAATSRSRQLAAELTALGAKSLSNSGTKTGDKLRTIYLQLASAAREEAKVISVLSVKLRLAQQTKTRKITAERERDRRRTGPRPWDDQNGRYDNSD